MKKSLKNLMFAGALLAFGLGSSAYAAEKASSPVYEVPRGAKVVVHSRKEAAKEVPKKADEKKKDKKEAKKYSDITVLIGSNIVDDSISYHNGYNDRLSVKGNEFYGGLSLDNIALPNDLKLNLGMNFLSGKESTCRDEKEIGNSDKRIITLSATAHTDWKYKGVKFTPEFGVARKTIENEGNYGSLKTKADNEYSGTVGRLVAEFSGNKSTSTAVPNILLSGSYSKLNSRDDKDISALNSRGFSFGLIYPKKNARVILSSLDKSIDGNNAGRYKAFVNDELSNETALSAGYGHLEARLAQYGGDVKGSRFSASYEMKKFVLEAGVDTKRYTQHFSNSDKDTRKRKVYASLQKRF